MQDDLEADGDEHERQRRAEQRAGHAQPGGEQQQRADEAAETLEHDRRADRGVGPQPL